MIINITVVILFLQSIGCALKGRPIDASVYLLNTNRSTSALLGALEAEMTTNKYEVEARNDQLGVLAFLPRKFVIPREDRKSFGEQMIQVRQEGGSVKIRISYRCEDVSRGDLMGPCLDSDKAATQKISKIERLILDSFNKHMYKSKADMLPKSIDLE